MKTYKQYVGETHPHQVSDRQFEGGVRGCPYNYGFTDPGDCSDFNWDCAACWGRKLIAEDLRLIENGLIHDMRPVEVR